MSVSQWQDAHEPAETCDARYPGREDVHHEFDCAGALRELLQNETAPLRVQLGADPSCARNTRRGRVPLVTPSAARIRRSWLQLEIERRRFMALPYDAPSVRGDHGFARNDVDFLLFGMSTEEIQLAAACDRRASSV